ncbi:MAG: hypothetical protein M1820_009235 [Bogoriella megaspora]|nr:MAG: hypothetical protein M1820_009235 [Bogoriella megaspora]
MPPNTYTLPDLPVSLPTSPIPDDVDFEALAISFTPVLSKLDTPHFVGDATWRDVFALTGTLRTFYGSISISSAWASTTEFSQSTKFAAQPSGRIVRVGEASWVDLPFTFKTNRTPRVSCSGVLGLTPHEEGWKIWCLRTVLESLEDAGDVDSLNGVPDNAKTLDYSIGVDSVSGAKNVNDLGDGNDSAKASNANGTGKIDDADDFARSETDFDCVVVGGGQAGLSTGGRLQALGISYVILDKHPEVGDSWKARYDSARLHTIREYSHLPFDRTFPESYQEFLTTGDLAKGYRDWVAKYGINIWQSTALLSGSWDANKHLWNLCIRRHEQESQLSCSYIVFAAGAGGQVPYMPVYANREVFQGLTLHSVEYKSAAPWASKYGVVVGTANTAHDIAEDMLQAGMKSVTMIQRSKTFVVPQEYHNDGQRRIYNSQIPTAVTDRNFMISPYAVSRLLANMTLHGRTRQETERFDALEKVGFKLDRYGELMQNLYERSGGHYMDIGTSAKIAKGLIKIKSDSLPISYTENGLQFSNGSHLRADVIVFATGFVGNLKLVVEDLFGSEIANEVGDFWGLDPEGELKGAYKPTGHPAFWYHGGSLGQARYFSRFIALQVKAKLLGTPLHVYEDTPRE